MGTEALAEQREREHEAVTWHQLIPVDIDDLGQMPSDHLVRVTETFPVRPAHHVDVALEDETAPMIVEMNDPTEAVS